MTRCRFCGIYYRCSTAEDYCSALCREKDENKRLKLMFDIKHTGSEANMMDARKKIEELKSQLEKAELSFGDKYTYDVYEKLTQKNTELKSQLASNHSYAQHVADDLGWYDRSELRKSMLDNLYKIIGDYPHPYIERLEKQLEGKE